MKNFLFKSLLLLSLKSLIFSSFLISTLIIIFFSFGEIISINNKFLFSEFNNFFYKLK